MNSLTLASGLSDHDLLARLGVLAAREREATVELVAHLAALDARPSLYAARGYGSLFGYCTQALRLSEDAACNRIEAARACRLPGGPRPSYLGHDFADVGSDAEPASHAGEPSGRPRARRASATKPRPIRPGTDRELRTPILPSRDIPNAVTRAVCRRDQDQCAYVAPDGRRCTERTFLEFHHLKPYAQGGRATVENISLRCRRHNQYEAELIFGPRTDVRRGPKAERHPPGDAARAPAVPPGPGTTPATPA